MKKSIKSLIVIAAAVAASGAMATEGGGSTYPLGVENFMSAAAPPPGIYAMEYLLHYTANKLKDNRGNDVPIPIFRLRADVAVTRFVWSTPQTLLGGNLLYQVVVPLVDQRVTLPGLTQGSSGLSDIVVGAALAHHYSPQLHSVVALDIVTPTGAYDKDRHINAGRNYWTIEPVYTMSYIDPTGFNGDFKAALNFNRTNHATQYQSGKEAMIDYAFGWGVGKGFTVGASGYIYRQFSDDSNAAGTIHGARASGAAIGPSIKYDNGHHWFVTVKWTQEMDARNRPQGSAFWLKTLIPI